mgnify:CR=1 FL=1
MARLTCKVGVQPPLVRLLCGIANVVAKEDTVPDVVITSANDGIHGAGSLHYRDCAVDIRTKNFASQDTLRAFLNRLKLELGDSDYDFVHEDPGGPNQHIHVEYDPKRH